MGIRTFYYLTALEAFRTSLKLLLDLASTAILGLIALGYFQTSLKLLLEANRLTDGGRVLKYNTVCSGESQLILQRNVLLHAQG